MAARLAEEVDAAGHLADGSFNVLEADSADFALRLRDDMGRLQAFERGGVNLIDAQGLLGEPLDATVYLIACAFDLELRLGQSRQALDGGRVIAFVRAA